MSGLAVLFCRDGQPVSASGVSAMLDAVPYRGPDGSRLRVDRSVGLGHASHQVTPEDRHEIQPWVSPRSGCVIVADVRLDNRDDLMRTLGTGPVGDAELIVRGYEAWGEDVATRLLGDFAYAIWDPRRLRLVCARDGSGQRSLFYRVDRRTFAAASEIHQLLLDPAIPIRPNDERIRASLVPANLYRNEKDSAATFYEGIQALPAGHSLRVTSESLTVSRFWHPAVPAPIRYRDPADYAARYRQLFTEVVRARLRTTGPVGVFLSGGLDSASVACTAQVAYREGLAADHGFTAISMVYDGLDCDERPFIEEQQRTYGFRTIFVPWEPGSGRLEAEPVGFLESPNAGVRSMRDRMFASARTAGVEVVLTGDIADAYVYGSRHVFDAFLRRGDLAGFWRHFRAFRRGSTESLARTLALSCAAPLLPMALQKRTMQAFVEHVLKRAGRRLVPAWMPDTLREDLTVRHRAACLDAERGRIFANPSLHDDVQTLWPPEVARHPAPWPIQIWRPFADRRLQSFMLAIPPDQRFEPHPDTDSFYAGSKWLVRRAMTGILPERIRTRTTKTLFTAAHAPEIRAQWPTYATVFGPGGSSRVAQHGYVDGRKFWERLLALRDGASGPDHLYVQQIVSLETWLRSLEQPRARLVAAAEVVSARSGLAAAG